GVAELAEPDNLSQKIMEVSLRADNSHQQRQRRGVFLGRYSYASAARKLHLILKESLSKRPSESALKTFDIVKIGQHVLGAEETTRSEAKYGIDVVMFWKQNDTTLYG